MTKVPKVSIIMNNYNNGKFIKEAINSILSQDYTDYELIIIDAFSGDDSREIIEELVNQESKIRKIFTKEYEPYPAVTYNLGFIHARGDYIAIADADDISIENRISSQVDYLDNNPEIEIVGSDCFEIYEDIASKQLVTTSVSLNIKNAAPPVRNPSIMMRKNVLSKYGLWDWRSEYAADYEWLYRMYSQGARFHLIRKPLIIYRKSRGNVSHKRAIDQTYKQLFFKIKFGFKTLSILKPNWILSILRSLIYLLILLIRKIFKKDY